MKKYVSIFASQIQEFVRYRATSGQWSVYYEKGIHHFDKYCHDKFHSAKGLTQEMIDQWCKPRETEHGNSCRSRIYVVITFIKYLNGHGLSNLTLPEMPKWQPRTYIPHSFTFNELKNFFDVCDSLKGNHTSEQQLRNITIPVFFRLLYSSGMRIKEARLIKVKDVNLMEGIINIRISKGPDQHFVVLHDSMLEVIREYNHSVEKIYPNRTFFFPAGKDSCLNHQLPSSWFRQFWDKCNGSRSVAYDLRHNYAIENINSWFGKDVILNSNFLYLSKSMGHRDLESTRYYYSVTPALADILKDKCNDSFNSLIPEIK